MLAYALPLKLEAIMSLRTVGYILRTKKNSMALFRKRSMPANRPPFASEDMANFCGQKGAL
jgi:hypothetical protein